MPLKKQKFKRKFKCWYLSLFVILAFTRMRDQATYKTRCNKNSNICHIEVLFSLSYWGVSRSIHKFKVWIASLKRGFFTLNLKCVLNSMDISLTLNMTIWIFRFALTHFAQNDKRCGFLLWLYLATRLVANAQNDKAF